MDVSDTQEFLNKLNEHLATVSYVDGFLPTQADCCIYKFLSSQFPLPQNLTHILRWYKHIQSFKQVEQEKFPKHAAQIRAHTSFLKLVEVGI
jgi:glutathione S-transferase